MVEVAGQLSDPARSTVSGLMQRCSIAQAACCASVACPEYALDST